MRIRRLRANVALLEWLRLMAFAGGLGLLAFTGSESAQAKSNLRGAVAEPKPVTMDKVAAPPVSRHMESVNFGHWVVTCEDSGGSKKLCTANLRVLGTGGKSEIANWMIGFDKDNHLVSVILAPTGLAVKGKDNKVSAGILVKSGLDVKLGAAAVRHLDYVDCNPQVCEAVTLVDAAFVKDAAAAAATSLTVYASDGTPVPLAFDSKGLDKAIAAVSAKNI